MKDWTTVTAGEIFVGDIIYLPPSADVYAVSGIGHSEKTGGPKILLLGARPITPNSNDIIEVYR